MPDQFGNYLGIYSPGVARRAPASTAPRPSLTGGRALSGGRVSVDDPSAVLTGSLALVAPFSPDEYWRDYKLDAKTLERTNPAKLMELLADLSPDVSRALWDFLLMCNPGWQAKAYRPGTKEQDKRAQEALDAFLSNLHGPYSAPNVTPADVVISALFMQPFLRGALCAELVLDGAGRNPLEIATPDPAHIKFRRVADPVRQSAWQMCQWQAGRWVDLNRPTISYVPVHPFPGSPYGRPLATPALFTTLFLLAILHDVRRVVQQQGWPRIDIAVKFDELLKMMPQEYQNDPKATKEWIEGAFSDIMRMYRDLEPDDAYVHPDAVEVKSPVGAVNSSSLGAVEGIIKALERQAVRALKTMPLLMGTTDGVSEANANRQWEIHVAGIKSLQHLCESLLERLLSFALQAQGIAAKVEFRFAELRAAELLRDAQVERLQIANEAAKRDQGWQTNDEAANKIVGHDAVAEPKAGVSAGTGGIGNLQAEPGGERHVRANGDAELLSEAEQ